MFFIKYVRSYSFFLQLLPDPLYLPVYTTLCSFHFLQNNLTKLLKKQQKNEIKTNNKQTPPKRNQNKTNFVPLKSFSYPETISQAQSQTKTKHRVCFVLANFWTRGLAWNMVDTLRNAPVEKMDSPFPSRYQLQRAA